MRLFWGGDPEKALRRFTCENFNDLSILLVREFSDKCVQGNFPGAVMRRSLRMEGQTAPMGRMQWQRIERCLA
jgi:hypothetical protein